MSTYYIGLYSAFPNLENRNSVLSATNKMNYIIDCLQKNQEEVIIVSAAKTKNNCYYPASFSQLSPGVWLKQFRTFGRKNIFTKALDIYGIGYGLKRYLKKHLTPKDKVIIYHSLSYTQEIAKICRRKGVKCIFEIEEIYNDVLNDKVGKEKELSYLAGADGYLFPTTLLNTLVNQSNKPYALIHGTYQVEDNRKNNLDSDPFCEKIHCVYAGTLDPRKGGAVAAATSSKFLPENYHMHILGFGRDDQVEAMKKLVLELSLKCKCRITFDGCLSGEEYIGFIQACDIGLSTQNPDAAFNATSFPSKILSYMANGLRVVSIRIPAVQGSAIGPYMYYYEEQTAEQISKAILSVNMSDDYDGRQIVSNLDKKFQNELKELLESV